MTFSSLTLPFTQFPTPLPSGEHEAGAKLQASWHIQTAWSSLQFVDDLIAIIRGAFLHISNTALFFYLNGLDPNATMCQKHAAEYVSSRISCCWHLPRMKEQPCGFSAFFKRNIGYIEKTANFSPNENTFHSFLLNASSSAIEPTGRKLKRLWTYFKVDTFSGWRLQMVGVFLSFHVPMALPCSRCILSYRRVRVIDGHFK